MWRRVEDEAGERGGSRRAMGAPSESRAGDKGIRSKFRIHTAGAVLARWKGDHLMGLIHSFHEPLEPPLGARPCVAAGIQERAVVPWMVARMERRGRDLGRHSHCYENTSWQFTNWHLVPGPVVYEFGIWGPVISRAES